MIKFILCIAIVAFTTFCGCILAKKFKQKKNFFSEFVVFNERFLSELTYFRRPIREFILSYSYHGEFLHLLHEFIGLDAQKGRSLQQVLNASEYSFLKADEKVVVINYFSMLGKADSTSQKAYFSSMKEALKNLENTAHLEYKKYSDLYKKIGFLLGLLIIILII